MIKERVAEIISTYLPDLIDYVDTIWTFKEMGYKIAVLLEKEGLLKNTETLI